MNYKSLNAIVIKNRHSLFSITKILNDLYKIKRFIKLNLKKVYYRFRIKKVINERRPSAHVMNILNVK